MAIPPGIVPTYEVILCNYNGRQLTEACLESLFRSLRQPQRVWVLDDCSTDGSVEYLSERFRGSISLVRSNRNVGPAALRNLAVGRLESNYVLTLDNDVLLRPDTICILMDTLAEDERIGCVVPKMLGELYGDHLVAAGSSLRLSGKAFNLGAGASADAGEFNRRRRIVYGCTATALFRTTVLRDTIQGFDAAYFHGLDDADVGVRINMAGFDVVYEPRAVACHHEGETVNQTIGKSLVSFRRNFLMYRGRLYILLKSCDLRLLPRCLYEYLKYSLWSLRAHGFGHVSPLLWALLWNFSKLGRIVCLRRRFHPARNFSELRHLMV